jgi:raffinose synthase
MTRRMCDAETCAGKRFLSGAAIVLVFSILCLAVPSRARGAVARPVLTVDSSGAVRIAVGGTDVAVVGPQINLVTGVLTAANGGLVAQGRDTTSGDDLTGAYDEVAVHYTTKDGQKAVTMILRARGWADGVGAGAAGQDYEGKLSLRGNVPLRAAVEFPTFRRGHGTVRFSQFWTRPFWTDTPAGAPTETQFFLWDGGAAGVGAIIPLVGGGMRGSIDVVGGFGVSFTAYDNKFRPKRVPVFALAFGKDPYAVVRRVYEAGTAAMGVPDNRRVKKPYPEMFEYFGYDTWNAYYRTIDREKVLGAARSFHDAGFPVRWMTIDDGWEPESHNMLLDFEANEKFPGGLGDVVKSLKRDYGLTWVGAFQTFQMYWRGIHPDSPIAKKHKKNIFKALDGRLIPDPRSDAGYAVFADYHSFMRDRGIDFVKVDYQSDMWEIVMTQVPIADAMRQQQRNLQASVGAHFDWRMINCMSMTIENVYFWQQSNISRAGDDFMPDKPDDPQQHVIDNAYNSLWQSELSWPDFDMFQSHHPAAEYHAAFRAISGGPIYVTDTPGMQKWDVLWKLVLPGGRILRADAPALPTKDVLFVDPAKAGVPLKVFNRVGAMGVVGAFNVRMDGERALGHVSATDVHGLPGRRFAVYEHFSGRLRSAHRGEHIPVSLLRQKAALFHFSPIRNGFAPIGIADKYLSGRTVLRTENFGKSHTVDLAVGGRFVAWLEHRPAAVYANARKLPRTAYTWKDNKLTVHVPKGDIGESIVVRIVE